MMLRSESSLQSSSNPSIFHEKSDVRDWLPSGCRLNVMLFWSCCSVRSVISSSGISGRMSGMSRIERLESRMSCRYIRPEGVRDIIDSVSSIIRPSEVPHAEVPLLSFTLASEV